MRRKQEALQQELDQLRAQISALEVSLDEKPDYGLGTGAPAVTRWELDRALLQRLKKRAASLERTLSGGDESAYGICAKCGGSIHPDRLAVLPDAKLCIRCARTERRENSAPQTDGLKIKSQS